MILILLPVYNEAPCIGTLLSKIKVVMETHDLDYRVLVINDGSHDGTLAVLQEYADRMPIEVLNHRLNRGLWETIRDGFEWATVHRPYNTDLPENLRNILAAFAEIEEPIIFPIHPRTRQRIVEFGLDNPQPFDGVYSERCRTAQDKSATRNPKLIEPVGYLDMLALEQNARMILTDSGGMQKEAYFLGVPCATLRPETEWVETVEAGWNVVTGTAREHIVETVLGWVWPSAGAQERRLAFGDGQASPRIVGRLEMADRRWG